MEVKSRPSSTVKRLSVYWGSLATSRPQAGRGGPSSKRGETPCAPGKHQRWRLSSRCVRPFRIHEQKWHAEDRFDERESAHLSFPGHGHSRRAQEGKGSFKNAMKGEDVPPFELKYVNRKGRTIYVEVRYGPSLRTRRWLVSLAFPGISRVERSRGGDPQREKPPRADG